MTTTKFNSTTLSRFRRNIVRGPHCWEWAGSTFSNGYGYFSIGSGKGRAKLAHRVSYTIHKGDPGSLVVMHTCDNKLCVRPSHLLMGTQSDNIQDMLSKGRHNVARGERSGNSKLTDENIREIRDLRKKGLPVVNIARLFSIDRRQVYKILSKEQWKHVL